MVTETKQHEQPLSLNSATSKYPVAWSERTRFPLFLKLSLVIAVLVLLRLPAYARDALFLGAVLLAWIVAIKHFSRVWMYFIFILPLIGLGHSLLGEPKLDMIRVFVVGMMAILILRSDLSRNLKTITKSHTFVGFAIFILANLVSAAFVAEIESAFRVFAYVVPLLFFIISYVVVKQDPNELRELLDALVTGGIIVSLIGLIEIAAQRSVVSWLGIPWIYDLDAFFVEDRLGIGGRVSSTLGHPIYAGFYFVLLLIIGVGYIRLRYPKSTARVVVFSLVELALIMATGSRGPLAGLAGATAGLLLANARRGRVWVAVIIAISVLVLVVVSFFPIATEFLAMSFELEDPALASYNVIGRLEMTRILLDVFRANWLFGYGPGQIQKQALAGTQAEFGRFSGVENQYAVILADGGILAGMSFLLFMIGAMRDSRRVLKLSAVEGMHVLGTIVLSASLAFFVVSVSVSTIVSAASLVFMTLLGAVIGLTQQLESQDAGGTFGE